MQRKYSDRVIIEVLGKNDEKETDKIFTYLYRFYYPLAASIIQKYGGHKDEIPDIFQEALIAFYENIRNKRFRGESSLNTYLYSMIKNIWFSRLKKIVRMSDTDPVEVKNYQPVELHLDDYSDELSSTINLIMEKLGDSCKKILKMYYFENCNMTEIKEIMGFRNEDSAKTQKYKCMKKLMGYINSKPALRNRLFEFI